MKLRADVAKHLGERLLRAHMTGAVGRSRDLLPNPGVTSQTKSEGTGEHPVPSLLVALGGLTSNTPKPPSGLVRARAERPVAPRRVTQRQRDLIVESYEYGQAISVVAIEVGVARSTVARVLRDRGVQIRPRGHHNY